MYGVLSSSVDAEELATVTSFNLLVTNYKLPHVNLLPVVADNVLEMKPCDEC